MTSIQIYNPQGYAYEAKWDGSVLFPITDSCERIANVMGEDCVRLVFKLPNKVVFDAFAYIVYNGQTFFLKEQYIPTPDGTFQEDSGEISTSDFSYDVKFVSVGNMLDKFICYRHVKVTNVGEWDEPEININGNLETLYVIIIGSIQQASNRLKAQYGQLYFADLLDTIVANGLDGNMPNTENVKLTANTNLLTFNFSGDNIANVCTTVANSFTNDDKKDTEWYIVENNGSLTLHFAKCVDVEYGVQYVSDYISNNNSADSSVRPQKSGGLKKVEYSQAWSGITNVIVPYGSTRNMSYQAAKGIDEITQMQSTFGKRLRLTPNTSYNVKDKEGNDVIITTDSHGAIRNNYVDTGIEQVKFYDEIYPQGHFRVTSVETKNKRQDGEIVPEYTVLGIAIDSKGNEIQPAEGFYPIVIEEGTTLSVRFEKGLLNGREFEIANKTRKDEGATTYSLKFTIVADGSIEDGTLIPSGNFIPREGDEFALFNMKMPEVYITAAQQELAQRAYDELVELQTSRPQVKCTTDPTTWDKPIALGYQFKVMSELFNSEDSFISRVTSYSHKLTKPYDVQFTLASAIMQGTLSQMNDLISDVTHQAGGLEQRAINLSRRGWRDAAEMAEMVDSLAADMMLVGNEKYQFAFTAGIEIVNSNNQTTAIKIGEGTLQHTQDPYISDYTCQGWWSHGAVTINNGHTENGSAALTSVPDTPFYLYAVVGQNSTDISFELQDQEQNEESYLLLGILSSAFTDTIDGVTTNYRVFNRTNGYTQISGGTITTEQIQDAGRNLIIDFQSNPPRIIARNGAEIIGNIKFKASDEMTAEEQLAALGIGVSNAQSAADAAQQTAEDEAEKVRKEYKAAIAESEDKMTEALGASVAEINGGIDALQKQVDGEVNSWFLEGTPANNYYPASEWTDNTLKERHLGDTYTNMLPSVANFNDVDADGNPLWVEQGILTVGAAHYNKTFEEQRQRAGNFCRTKSLFELNESATLTWTNTNVEVLIVLYDINKKYITNYSWDKDGSASITSKSGNYYYFSLLFHKIDGSNITPSDLIGISCNKTFICPEAGLSWRWCNFDDMDDSTWHWHKIADSDAVKALQEAAKAQSTADGKSTTFIAEPKNYDIGDLWILAADRTLNGNTYKQGTILTANAASATFVASHWSEKVKYIDESIAAQQAQQALDGLEIGGRNLLRDSALFTHTASANINYSYKILTPTVGLQPNTDYVFSVEKGEMTVGSDTAFTVYLYSTNIITPRNKLTIPISSTRQSVSFKTTAEVTDTDVVLIYAGQQGTTAGKTIKLTNIKLEKGNKVTAWSPAPEDVDSKADAIKAIADGAAASAQQSNDQLANMSNDNILTPQEKGSVADEWACIQKEYAQNSTNKTTAWGSATVAEWTAYNNAYTTLQTYVGTLALTDRKNNTTIVKSTFQANFANYYSANVAFLNALSKKVAELEVAAMEIGGRNLLARTHQLVNTHSNITSVYNTNDEIPIPARGNLTYVDFAYVTPIVPNGTEYILTFEAKSNKANAKINSHWYNPNTTTSVQGSQGQSGSAVDGSCLFTLTTEWKKYWVKWKQSETTTVKNCIVARNLISQNGTDCIVYVRNVKLEQGNKATDWTPAPEDVDAAVLEAKESAELANAQLDAIDNDNVIAISERASLETQLEQIQSEYNEITNDMNRYSIDTTNYEKAADKAIEALQYHCGKVYDGTNTAPINADKSITIVAGTSVRHGYGNISAYYTARQTALESIAAAVKASAEQYADNAAQNAADEAIGYVDIYTGGNKSHNYLQGDSAQILHLCNISSNAAYITSVKEDNGSGGSMIDPFGSSCLFVWSKNVGAPVNYYEIFDFGINNVYGVYRWGDTINCPKDAQLLVCLAQYDYISYCVENNEFSDNVYPQNGTWALNDIKVYTNNALIAQAAMYKAEGLDYLKTALEDGSTEIAGGLTMTNVLMLKNIAGSVTAGMSGLTTHENKEDKVLMWGGGTYEEAYAAANNNTYNTGSGTITTLLKKDGTGKIGAFWIDKDTIKVVSGEQTTIITNKNIEDAAPLQSTKSISTATKEYSAAVSLSSQGTKTYGKSGSYTQIASYSYTVPAGKYNLNGELSANYCRAGGTIASGSNSGDVSYSYINGLRIRVVQNGTTLATLTGSMSYSQTANYGSSGLQVFSSGSISTGTISSTTSEFSANSGNITIYIEAKVYGYAKLLSGLSGSAYSETEFAFSFLLKGLDKYTVIANDGIAVITNSESQFYINNDSDSLNVKMRGLPTSSTGLVKGDLYTSSGYLRIVT